MPDPKPLSVRRGAFYLTKSNLRIIIASDVGKVKTTPTSSRTMMKKQYPSIASAVRLTILAVGSQFLVGIIAGIAVSMASAGLKHASISFMTGAVNIISIGVVLFYGWRKTHQPIGSIFIVRKTSWQLLAATVIVSCGAAIVLSEIDNVFRMLAPMPAAVHVLLNNALPTQSPLQMIVLLVIIAPLTEELFFRGLMLQGLLRNGRPASAIVITAVLFSLFHLNPWQMLSAFFLGIIYAWLMYRSGSLVPCMIGHAVNNGMVVLSRYWPPFQIPGFTGDPTDAPILQPWWFDIIGIALFIIGIIAIKMLTPQTVSEWGVANQNTQDALRNSVHSDQCVD